MKITGVGAYTFRGFVILEHIIEIVSAMQTVCLSATHTHTQRPGWDAEYEYVLEMDYE